MMAIDVTDVAASVHSIMEKAASCHTMAAFCSDVDMSEDYSNHAAAFEMLAGWLTGEELKEFGFEILTRGRS